MSGTPIQNSLEDFLSLFKFLCFRPYDNRKQFDDDFFEPWRNKKEQESIDNFKKLLSSIMLRRLKKSTVKLPPRSDKLIPVQFSEEERIHYSRIEQPVIELLDHPSDVKTGMTGLWFSAIQQIHKLRVSSASPEPNKEGAFQVSSKIQALAKEIRAYPNEKSVIFSFWTSSLDMVQEALEAARIRYVRIDGKIPTVNRQRALKQLSDDPETKAILPTVSCGAVRIDLTAASRVHLLEPQWNPSLEEQALARVHRIGQAHPVTTIRYVIQDSLEEVSKDSSNPE
ncbi:MAG: hypothetical protein M1821_007625 [Bathelium mastoideum]|nr:MAG: hypothetical protein M1821_007625 [Bathelium mastoideum]